MVFDLTLGIVALNIYSGKGDGRSRGTHVTTIRHAGVLGKTETGTQAANEAGTKNHDQPESLKNWAEAASFPSDLQTSAALPCTTAQ